jgi:hypothetical protein
VPELIPALEDRFRRISLALYDTSVPADILDREVLPYLADDVRFTDPWQQGAGRETYRKGAAGFHCMFRFDFDIFQLNVQLDEQAKKGRAIVDGVMNLKQLSPLVTYPLRTILVYEFTGLEPAAVQIHEHIEMWSFGDMIEAVPLAKTPYKLFRNAFSKGFVAASALCRRLKAST